MRVGILAAAAVITACAWHAAAPAAPLALDEFGAHYGRSVPFQGCLSPTDSLPLTCKGPRQDVCRLLDLANSAPEAWRRSHWMMKASRAFQQNGFNDAARTARAGFDIEMALPERRDGLILLYHAQNFAAHCMPEAANRLIKEVESKANETASDWGRVQILSHSLFVRAQLGMTDDLDDRLLLLRKDVTEKALFAERPDLEIRVRRALAMAAAEGGRFDVAIELAPANDPLPLVGQIAQIAIRHGDLERAVGLVGAPTEPESADNWTPVTFARLALLEARVDRGHAAEAERLVSQWGALRSNSIHGPLHPSLPRVIALSLATREPGRALRHLSNRDALACTNAVALLAARAGMLEQALSIADANAGAKLMAFAHAVPPGEVEIRVGALGHIGIKTDSEAAAARMRKEAAENVRWQAEEGYARAIAGIAKVYADKGNSRRALEVLDGAAHAVFNIMPKPMRGAPVIIAEAYADIGQPDRGFDFLQRIQQKIGEVDGRWLTPKAVASAARRLKIAEAMTLSGESSALTTATVDIIMENAGVREVPLPIYADPGLEPCSVLEFRGN